jgi:hypothetical protein
MAVGVTYSNVLQKAASTVFGRFLDTGDAKSTGNLRKHVKKCWGEHALEAAGETKNANEARTTIVQSILEMGTIKSSFERKGNGKVSYSHRQHTKAEMRLEIVRWVSESLRPFEIVKDSGFQRLMKTGRPEYYLPSPSTVSRDVRLVFVQTRKQIARMLQVGCSIHE